MVDRHPDFSRPNQERWLKRYYFSRAVFSLIWVALALSVGRQSPAGAAILFVVYPAWDALANFVDMSRSGGMAINRTQAANVAISAITTVAVFLALGSAMYAVLTVFGVWAILSGVLQLGTAVRRWKHFGAQWAMVLSGAQSALAGTFFIVQSHASAPPAIIKIAGYAAVGAIYFLISAISLHVMAARRRVA
ncbi:DUF308 domain-containing protein [Paraburkholderia caballeronis]|uniref:DUF308 domain-containing protein n=1 Tax=Paraburkholderia caballeronis TaxID=416943 RepID=A0A1H7LTA0_9BURK|nr:DUF308 domain-containing protein [Paraburkholderia caballeronis]PXW28593.1 hypothetical protein C7403_102487 [Paraburkholderia caballeronis]PXX03959.1 hypothetical protein C7407_102487 [Paraburkholderia caballeronis]RAK04703.1 hypothetical protein C7409_102487 [Paraburkholderia caballeronis]SED68930.1 hypothetical protein SAMN05445871_3689 [Paraburkholderia caballeronis]SEL02146.1 hypothetical protein SAMN05192542_104488 [Paraburkholderia caballeronis]